MRGVRRSVWSRFVGDIAEFISALASVLRNLVHDVSASYRPELCYMRGPGPKWRARARRR